MMTDNRKKIVLWILVALWAAFIFLMSAHTGSELDNGTGIIATIKRFLTEIQLNLLGPDIDIVPSLAHFCEYTVFGALLQIALKQEANWKRALIFAILIGSVYGITDEIHQIFVPNRACDPIDWIVDTTGSALGASIAAIISNATGKSRSACSKG